jgi:hypothetical protein
MSDHEVTHREIYDRLVAVEAKVDALSDSTKDVTTAFMAAQGAFKVLETLSKLAKPLLWIAGLIAAIAVFIQDFKSH